MGGYMATAKTDLWSTPRDVIEAIEQEFGPIELDVAASKSNAVCQNYFDIDANGLDQDWKASLTYANPPYGRVLLDWVRKALNEYDNGNSERIVMLLPSRTDVRWFHLLYERPEVEIRFLKGRLKYGSGTAPAPFGSIIVIIGKELV